MKKSIYTERYKKFCAIMIDLRKKKNLTQVQLANLLNKPQSFVSKYENAERRLDIVEFLEICKVLKIESGKIIKKI